MIRNQANRLRLLQEARAILAVAAITKVGSAPHYECPHYSAIAKALGLGEKSAEEADEIYNKVNGPDEWTQSLEEHALERVNDLIRIHMEDS